MGLWGSDLGEILLREENRLPWPDTRAAILRGLRPTRDEKLRGVAGVATGGARGGEQPLSVRNFNARYSAVSRIAYLPVECERQASDVEFGQRNNTLGFAYRHHMISRIRARVLENPQVTFTGWSALRMLGLPYWVNDMPVQIIAPAGGRKPRSEFEPHILSGRGSREYVGREAWRAEFHDLPAETRCVNAEVALAHALKTVLRREATWWLPQVSWLEDCVGLSREEIRGVQLLDAARRFLPGDMLGAVGPVPQERGFAPGIVNQRQLRKLVARSTHLADSPMETLLRLVLQSVLPDLKAQVTLMQAGFEDEPLTTADLWSPSSRIAIFYDGKHHGSAQQRHVDARIDRDLQSQGIRVLRFTNEDMRYPGNIIDSVTKMVEAAHSLG